MGYDSRCLDLAEQLLESINPTELEKIDLAQIIQDAIENWMAENIKPGRRII